MVVQEEGCMDRLLRILRTGSFVIAVIVILSASAMGATNSALALQTPAATAATALPTMFIATPDVTLQPTATTRQQFDGESALKFAAAQVNFGYRPTGSDAWRKTGDYIIATLRSYGWKVTTQPFTVDVNGTKVNARNIQASIGSGPVVIIGAHYDTRIYADAETNPEDRTTPVIGANDGASGVAVLLELGRVLGQHYTYNRELRLVFFDAEDNGNIPGWPYWILGSTHYAENLDVKPEYVIVLDMIGDKDLNTYYETNSMQSAPTIVTDIWNVAAKLGYEKNFIREQKFNMVDDHMPFIRKGIPSVDIIDFDYPHWHRTTDTLDKISAESLGKVGRVVQVYLEQTGAIK
jgi:glutaminyl-peptide cyclotransferase